MTPRKELYTAIKEKLETIGEIEYIDWFRGQFSGGVFPDIWTAALIRIPSIRWETMVEHKQEGTAVVEILFYCKDGWMNQWNGTQDCESGLIEIDVLDRITQELQFLNGEQFKPLKQISDQTEQQEMMGIMTYKLIFSTMLYRHVNYPYSLQKIDKQKIKIWPSYQ